MLSPNQHQLNQVHYDNVRNHQLVDDEVAADMGFEVPEDYDDAVRMIGGVVVPESVSVEEDVDQSRRQPRPIELPRRGRSNSSNLSAEHTKEAKEYWSTKSPEEIEEQREVNRRGAQAARDAIKKGRRRALGLEEGGEDNA